MRVERVIASVVLLTCILLAGCSVTPTVCGMSYEPPPSTFTPSGKTIFVSEAQDALQNPGLRQAQFVEALKGSIEKAELFKVVDQPTKADYQLFSSIVEYRPPTGGTVMTCHLTVRYTLKRPPGTEPVWHEEVACVQQYGIGDYMVGTTRCRKVSEHAARKNIEACLNKLAAMKL